jgi:hypothetical protein
VKGDGVHPLTAIEADNSCKGKNSRQEQEKTMRLLLERPEGVFFMGLVSKNATSNPFSKTNLSYAGEL